MKKRILWTSLLTVLFCVSLIVGATMALFSDRSDYDISVKSGKIDIEANIEGFVSGDAVVDSIDGESGMSATFADGAIDLSNICPGDKVIVKIGVENRSTIAFLQRVALSCRETNSLFDQLLVGFSNDNVGYKYYSEYVSAWGEYEDTIYVSIELPLYVSNDWQGKSCQIALSVEAMQTNGAEGEEEAKEIYPVENTSELSEALLNFADCETIVLYGAEKNWTEVAIDFTGKKTLILRGNDIGDLSINAPDGSVYLYNNVQTISSLIVADESLHIFGNVGSIDLRQGRAVVEGGAAVQTVNVAPAANAAAKVELAANAVVERIAVNTAAESAASVIVAENVTLPKLEVAGSGEVTIDNDGIIEDSSIDADANVIHAGSGETAVFVTSAAELQNAFTIDGVSVVLAAPIDAGTITVPSGAKIVFDLNGFELKANIVNNGTLVVQGDGTITDAGDHTVINNGDLTAKSGVIDNVTHGKAAVVNNSGAIFTLAGGTLTRSQAKGTYENNNGNSYYVLENNGTALLQSGAIEAVDGWSSLIRNVAAYTEDLSLLKRAEMIVSGGSYSGGINTIKNDAYCDLTITGGTFANSTQNVILNYDVAEISGGTFIAEDSAKAFFVNLQYMAGDDSSQGLLSIRDVITEGDAALFGVGGTGTGGSSGTFTVFDAEILQEALNLNAKKVVRFGCDIEVESSDAAHGISVVQISWKLTTIEFNGYKLIDRGVGVALYIDNAQVVLQDSVGGGGIEGGSGGNNQAILVDGYYGANVTINSGTYTVGADANGEGNSCIEICRGNMTSFIINGGTFSSAMPYKGTYFVLNLRQTGGVTDTSQFKVRGGTFIGQDPAQGDDALGGNFLGNYSSYEYVSVQVEDTDGVPTWTVMEKQAE